MKYTCFSKFITAFALLPPPGQNNAVKVRSQVLSGYYSQGEQQQFIYYPEIESFHDISRIF